MANVVIKTSKLVKKFKRGETYEEVLKGIDLEIFEGDFTVIMGSSGSGKSTLLYAISSMDRPSSGSVEIAGKDISKMSEIEISEIRKRDVSFVFQNVNLIPDLTAFENIAYPAYLIMGKTEANEQAEKLLRSFDLIEQRNKYPSEMSGGQQQKIAIARAVIGNPKILFGDEPTGALNSKSGIQVLDLFTEINKSGQTIVMVTHDIKAGARGNRVLYLKDGAIIDEHRIEPYSSGKQVQREAQLFQMLNKNNW
ncbi:MAG: ABC transporter ATP-binding protein [Oscillospiraceae bacterium]|nr:ABC transporter ATP-binding protein [Oscillospiraceae bacterium]